MSTASEAANAKYGPNGDLVSAFINALTAGGLDWQQVVADSRTPERRSAIQAVGDVPWPAPRLAAVDKAGLDAFAALGLSRSDFSHPLDLGALKVAISAASKAVALCDRVGADVVRTLLQPFANQGVAVAHEAIARASQG
ncbi:hypothetical protein [Cellulomonas sp. JZ18]|uniref:hypothetical protein n=1 Tax=Cellulomonas sp. JZ18 TaxID=2654191 RepID=UPI001E479715|nr:hypothetical protein [Cellulomonas sp. JZ18]